MKRTLISGLGGSLFPYFDEQIRTKFETFYVDSNESLRRMYSKFKFYPAPKVGTKDYEAFISELLSTLHIDIYMPLIDEEILQAHDIAKPFKNLFLFSPSKTFSVLCLNKLNLMRELARTGISQIRSWRGDEYTWTDGSCIFLKPINGRGSRGIRKIKTYEELKAYYVLERYRPEEILVQEFIDGQEYTVGLTTNSRDQILCITPKKVIQKKGITQEAVIQNDSDIIKLCHQINEQFKPKGAINIQLYRTASNELKVFEINPRFSTTSIMSFAGGLDEFSLLINEWDRDFQLAPILAREGVRLIRRWENLFYES